MKQFFKKANKKILAAAVAVTAMLSQLSVYAVDETKDTIGNSKPVTGTKNLLNDISSALMVIAPILCGVVIVFFLLRMKTATEEHEKAKWKKNAIGAGVTLAIVFSVSSIIAIITNYYK